LIIGGAKLEQAGLPRYEPGSAAKYRGEAATVVVDRRKIFQGTADSA
jgi:hypothetical protein